MFPLLGSLLLAQAPPNPVPQPIAPKPTAPQSVVITQPQDVRPLPGQLDSVLVFNSNSPEVVQTEGILLSTFPQSGKAHPEAHLTQAFQGRFDLFAHHIAKAKTPEDLKTLYLGILVYNPGLQPVRVDVLQAASYLSQPDAPFIALPPTLDNPIGAIYAGPGDRVTNDILRGMRQADWPAQLVIPPGESQLLLNAPIPVKGLTPPINGRSTLAYLRSNGPVHVASLAQFAKRDGNGQEQAPTLTDWQTLLNNGTLSGPRDKVPTVPGASGPLIYGRVAGVAKGGRWQTQVVDAGLGTRRLTIPQPGKAFSYILSSVARGTFGTGQVQSAPMVVRYPDTAYAAHGNYGVQYSLSLPLYNPQEVDLKVTLALQTPLKTDEKSGVLKFNNPPPQRVFFRGTIRVRYQDDQGAPKTRYVHLVQFQGQQGDPLVELRLKGKSVRLVQVDFLYPPDATPPQVLTIKTE